MNDPDGQHVEAEGVPTRALALALALDEATLTDLGVFQPTDGGSSLFAFCNRTRTRGGADALGRRMKRPWSDRTRILATQSALAFVARHRDAFVDLPSDFLLHRSGRYLGAPIVMVRQTGTVEFGLTAAALWMNDFRQYAVIAVGVGVAQRLLEVLRAFIRQPEFADPPGELAGLFAELRECLADPALAAVPDEPAHGRFWRTLRHDQLLRMHGRRAMERMIAIVYELDALIAMADTCTDAGFVVPELVDGPLSVAAEGLVHPLVEDAVANPALVDAQRRLLFLTGPNMAGKTTYLRAFSIAVYLAHLGMGVPAQRFRFAPADALFSAIALQDDLHGGVSYFRAEALRVKAVAQALAQGRRVIAVLDEPFKGTNVKDALDASGALLVRFAACENGRFMVSSHLIELEDALAGLGTVDCRHFEADESEARLRFDYRLRDGVSRQRLGMRVLEEEGVFTLLDGARREDP